MGREHTFMDEQFGTNDYNRDDDGDFEADLVFIAMSFDKDMDDVHSAIKEECSKLGLKLVRADDSYGSGFIIREVTNLIEKAEFLIFDLTQERPNVYYELGYAHGVENESKEILLIAREGTKIHFDNSPLRIRFYKDLSSLRDIVSSSLNWMIRNTR